MMEALQLLVEMVADLPEMALWVVALYFFYQLSIVGSIYGCIRFVTSKAADVMIKRSTARQEVEEMVSLEGMVLNKKLVPRLMAQLERIRNSEDPLNIDRGKYRSSYVDSDDVAFLEEAITEAINKRASEIRERSLTKV